MQWSRVGVRWGDNIFPNHIPYTVYRIPLPPQPNPQPPKTLTLIRHILSATILAVPIYMYNISKHPNTSPRYYTPSSPTPMPSLPTPTPPLSQHIPPHFPIPYRPSLPNPSTPANKPSKSGPRTAPSPPKTVMTCRKQAGKVGSGEATGSG